MIEILEEIKKDIQRELKKAKQVRNKYFKEGNIEIFYFWDGYVGALYDILTLIKELEGGVRNE